MHFTKRLSHYHLSPSTWCKSNHSSCDSICDRAYLYYHTITKTV